jgi:V/A-type H+-transporting ATPase subunit A
VHDEIGRLEDGTPLRLAHAWPVRTPRPVGSRLGDDRPLVTGPAGVSTCSSPWPRAAASRCRAASARARRSSSKSLAKHADADVVVYVGCGERGNEMSEVLHEFPRLTDARTGDRSWIAP